MQLSNNNTPTGRNTNVKSISGGHQNRQETHSAHSSISVTRVNRDKSRSAKPDFIGSGNHRKDKNYNIFKDNNVVYITKNPSEISYPQRRTSDQIEHINERQTRTSPNTIRTNETRQSENSDIENSNRKKSVSSNISRNIQIQLRSNRVSDDHHRISIDYIDDLRHNKKRKRLNPFYRYCCILSLSILAIGILAAILATTLSLLLKNSTSTTSTISVTSQTGVTTVTKTTTTTTTTVTSTITSTSETLSSTSTTTTGTTTSCATSGLGNLLSLNGTDPVSWTLYEFNYTATHSSPIIAFGFKTNNNFKYYLDDVSVVDINVLTNELLQNSNFDNSSTVATDWSQWCGNTCNGQPGMMTSSGNCYSGYCYVDNCYTSSNNGIDFIGQAFSATIGLTYTISFRLRLIGSGSNTNNAFYADII